MSEKTYEQTWLPADWMDEYIPATLRHPTDFLHRRTDGSLIVTPKISKDDLRPEGDGEERSFYTILVETGDIVRCLPQEAYGTFNFHVANDLTTRILGEFPSKANTFYLPDTETVGDSLDEAISLSRDLCDPLEPGDYQVNVYWWGDAVVFRVEVSADGTACFVKIAEVH